MGLLHKSLERYEVELERLLKRLEKEDDATVKNIKTKYVALRNHQVIEANSPKQKSEKVVSFKAYLAAFSKSVEPLRDSEDTRLAASADHVMEFISALRAYADSQLNKNLRGTKVDLPSLFERLERGTDLIIRELLTQKATFKHMEEELRQGRTSG